MKRCTKIANSKLKKQENRKNCENRKLNLVKRMVFVKWNKKLEIKFEIY